MNGFTIQILIDCWGISHLLFIGQKKSPQKAGHSLYPKESMFASEAARFESARLVRMSLKRRAFAADISCLAAAEEAKTIA